MLPCNNCLVSSPAYSDVLSELRWQDGYVPCTSACHLPACHSGSTAVKGPTPWKHHNQGSLEAGGFSDVDGQQEGEAGPLPRIAPRPGMDEVRTPVQPDGSQAGWHSEQSRRTGEVCRVAWRWRAVRHNHSPVGHPASLFGRNETHLNEHSWTWLRASVTAAAKSSIPSILLGVLDLASSSFCSQVPRFKALKALYLIPRLLCNALRTQSWPRPKLLVRRDGPSATCDA